MPTLTDAAPTPLGQNYDPTYFDTELDAGDVVPEVHAFFSDPEEGRDMVSGASTGMHVELIAVKIGSLQLSRDQFVAMTSEAQVSQIEEQQSEGLS